MLGLHVLYMALSGLAFAALDLIRKLLAGRVDALALVGYMSLGSLPLFGVLLALQGPGPFDTGYLLPGLGALVLNFLGNLGFIHSVKLSPLSRTIPLLSLTPAFTALLGIPILGEIPSPTQAAGIAMVVAGAVALNREKGSARPLRDLLRERGAAIMVVVALMWSLSGPLDKLALAHAGVLLHATVMTAGVAAGAFVVLALRGSRSAFRIPPGTGLLLAASMVAVSAAIAFQLLAIRGVFVSLVEAFKRSLGSVLAVALGRLVFGETIRAVQAVAVLLMATGVVLILL